MDVVIIEAVGLALAFAVAAFCSASRSALAELEVGDASLAADDDSGKLSDALKWWRARRRGVALVLAIGHRLAVISAVVLVVILFADIAAFGTGEWIAMVAALTLAIVVLTDVIPTTIARSYPSSVGLLAVRLLFLPYLLSYPVTKPLLAFRRFFSKIVGEEEREPPTDRSRAQQVLRRLAEAGSSFSANRRQLVQSVVEFPGTVVREVMVPRTDVVAISEEMELDEILLVLLEFGHSRIPVYEETVDDIKGVFYAKDLIQLMASGEEFKIEGFLRRPYFVPETKPISELLTEFQRQHVHLAVVVDEFGGTAGLITLEDIIEEFFGDIQDEYDVEPEQLIRESATSTLADARIGIDEVEEYFGIELPQDEEYDSLGGFLLAQVGSVPAVGDEITWEPLTFRIVEASEKRIDTVQIERRDPASEPAEIAL